MRKDPLFLVTLLVGTLVLGGLLFFVYQKTRDLITGPRIEVISPENGALVEDQVILLTGIAENVSWLRLNGRQIFTNEKSEFKETVLLSYGYNILEIQGEDRFGKKKIVTTELILK